MTAERRGQVNRDVPRLWVVLQEKCSCRPTSCPHHLPSTTSTTAGRCAEANCEACQVYAEVVASDLVSVSMGVGANKNARLAMQLKLAPLILRLYHAALADVQDDRASRSTEASLTTTLASLLCCGDDKVRRLKSVGKLHSLAPFVLNIQLARGWSRCLDVLRKVSTAVLRQVTNSCSLIALACIRKTLQRKAATLEDGQQKNALLQWSKAFSAGPEADARLEREHFVH